MKLIEIWKRQSSDDFKRKLIKAAIAFFLLMMALTIISRTAFSVTAAQVKTALPGREKITHDISASGELKGKQELAVRAPEGLVIQKVCVSEGESITKGRTLLVLEPSSLAALVATYKEEQKEKAADMQPGETGESAVTEEQKQELLRQLLNLQANGGRVSAPGAGLITEVSVKAGDRTTGGGDIRYADAMEGLLLTASFSQEDREYLKKSGKVTVEGDNGKSITDLKIKSIAPDKENPDTYLVTAEVPSKNFQIGSMAEMKVSSADKTYNRCIPREALHQAENGNYYVYVITEVESVLGTQLKAQQAEVTVADKDETTAAVDGLEDGQEVIVEASRELEDQCRVRRVEL